MTFKYVFGLISLMTLFLAVACGSDGTSTPPPTDSPASPPEPTVSGPGRQPSPTNAPTNPRSPTATTTTPTQAATFSAQLSGDSSRTPKGTVLTAAEVDGLVHLGIRSSIGHIVGLTGNPVGQLEILEAQEAVWPDASLGCPEPGNAYAQVLTSGLRLVLAVEGSDGRETYDYRVTDFHGTLCEQDGTEAPIETRPLVGVWSRLADMPTPRSEVAAARVHGKIYVIGGFGAGATANEVYDIETNTWSVMAPLPEGVDHAAAVVIAEHVYLIGGYNGRWAPQSHVWAYFQESDTWSRRADLPTARGALGAAVIEGKIYAVGGVGPNGNVGTLEVYDPAQDAWETLAPMPKPRDHIAVAAAGGKLYVAGGRLGSFARNLSNHDEYDPVTGEWNAVADLPTPRSGNAAATVAAQTYVFGGESTGGTFDKNERFTPSTGLWESLPPLPTARHGLAAIAANNRIYVLAGGPTPGGSASGLVLPESGP